MKKIFFISLILLQSVFLFSAPIKKKSSENQSWRLLEKAQVLYDSAKFGDALDMAIKAKETRYQESTWEYNVLEKAINPKEVVRVGNHFNDVIKILEARDETLAISIIKEYIDLYGTVFFNENIRNLVNWLKEKAVYPEADYLIGKIYQLEGEYKLAENYYQEAYKNAKFLDIPDRKFDVLYSMAKLAKENNDDEKYENILILVLSDNPDFANKNLLEAMERTVKTDKNENVDKFFSLYRSESNLTLDALYQIVYLYDKQDDKQNALKSSCLGAVEAFTHINNSLVERDSDYKYSTFSAFLIECSHYEDIQKWAIDNHVWELFYLLGEKSLENNSFIFGRKIFYDLSRDCPNDYWKKRSLQKLVK